MSREDALTLMVLHMHDAHKTLQAMRRDQLILSPVPVTFANPEVQ